MDVAIHESWKPYLINEFEKPYFKSLARFVKEEYSKSHLFSTRKSDFQCYGILSF